jgi:hypothetical protein
VCREPPWDISSESDVGLRWVVQTTKKIDVAHGWPTVHDSR